MFVEAGVIVGAHGIGGELKFKPAGEIDAWTGLTLYEGKDGSIGHKITGERRHKGLVLMTIEGVQTRSDAERLTGTLLYINEKDLPPPAKGEYYYYQLIGMDVCREDGSRIGRLAEVIATGANDVFRIVDDIGAETLVAAISDVILGVDVDARRMTIRPPVEMEDEAE